MKEIEINLYGVLLYVYYDYQRGEEADYYYGTPGTPDYCKVKEVYISGTEWDIYNSMTPSEIEQLEATIIEKNL